MGGFDQWSYYKYWFAKHPRFDVEYADELKAVSQRKGSKAIQQIVDSDPLLKSVSELVPIYTKWHFFMQQSSNYDLMAAYPCSVYNGKKTCKIMKRVCVLMLFFNEWVRDTINMKSVEVKREQYFSCCDFIQSLDLYDADRFSMDLDHILDFHLYPQHEMFQELLFCHWKKERVSIYQFVLDKVGGCDVENCGIFERYNIAKYDREYLKQHKSTLFAIKTKDINTERGEKEVELQRKLDECHVALWHSEKKYATMKLKNSTEYGHFKGIVDEWKQSSLEAVQ